MAEPDFTGPFLQMMFVLLVVIAVVFVVLKFVLPKLNLQRAFGNSNVKVISRTPIDFKKSVCIVEVEGKRILLGLSETQVNFLCELGEKNKETEA